MYKQLTDAEIGQVIREKRIALRLTQTQLGEKLGVGHALYYSFGYCSLITRLKKFEFFFFM